MNKKHLLLSIIILFLSACQAQKAPEPTQSRVSIIPADTSTLQPAPTETIPLPTETPQPTETATLIPPSPTEAIDTDVFGFINAADAKTGFILDPIVGQIFEIEMQKKVDVGEIEAFQIESLGLYPRANGTLYAEVFYRVKTENLFWPEDFGTPAEDGWITGKCTRFDFESTPDAFFLKNKKVCS